MKLPRSLLAFLFLGFTGPAFAYPVTVASCSDPLTVTHAPQRAVVNDKNMVQTVIDMGLARAFVGFGSVKGSLDQKALKGPPDVLAYVAAHQIADRYPTTEALLGANPDFYFAGWGFGFSEATSVTPQALARFGIQTYVLNETCIRVGKRAPVSMETMYTDMRALGRIFGVEDHAERMIADFKSRIAAVTARVAKAAHRPRVMYCDPCNPDGPPLTSGAEDMPTALITLAGGTSLYPDISNSYVRVSWETVVKRDPEWILLSTTRATPGVIIRNLTSMPALQNITAIKKRQFIFMTYADITPSTRNVEAVERLARTLHPELFEP